MKTTLADTVAIAQKIEKMGHPFYAVENLNSTLVLALAKTQSVLATENAKQWQDTLELTRKSLKASLDNDTATALTVAEFSGILQREAFVASKATDPVRATRLREEGAHLGLRGAGQIRPEKNARFAHRASHPGCRDELHFRG